VRAGRRPVLLDGAKGTELQRLGVPVTDPWWTTSALLSDEGRALLTAIHRDYAEAGAELTTANTFRTNLRALLRAGAEHDQARTLVRTAVEAAREAIPASCGSVVAASMTSVEDCYQPQLVPTDDEELRREHGWLADQLRDAGVELVMAETMNTVREAVAATAACATRGLPVWTSFVCTSGARLLSGEGLVAAAHAVADTGASMVLVNCTTLEDTDEALEELAADCPVPIGAYPNLEDRSELDEWQPVNHYVPVRHGPEDFADLMAERAIRFGLAAVGGCCGSTPAHIAALHARLGPARPRILPGRSVVR